MPERDPALPPQAAEPHPEATLLSQAIAAHQACDHLRAEHLYNQALAAQPDNADAHHNLGVLLTVQLLRPEDALPHFEAALNLQPQQAQFWFSYIDAVLRTRQTDLADQLITLVQAQQLLAPAMVNALRERLAAPAIGVTAAEPPPPPPPAQPAPPSARAPLTTAAATVTQRMRAIVGHLKNQQHDDAVALARDTVARHPADGRAWKALNVTLQTVGEHAAALDAAQQAVHRLPQDAEAWSNLGHAYQACERFDEAIAALQTALRLRPQHAAAHNNLAICYQQLGQHAQAEDAFCASLALKPLQKTVFDNRLFCLNYDADRSGQEIYEAYQEYERRFGQPLRAGWTPHPNSRLWPRRLKIGYVSPDFRNHSCRFFMEPLLARHDHQAFEVYAYADLTREDAVTQRYKRHVDHWVPTRGMPDDAMARRIRSDGIDILIDLAGHTSGNRLGVFARKPAPVSVSWLGYGYTTGLQAIDYFLTDEHSAPPGCEALFSETPWRMPGGSCVVYRPGEGMGEVSPLPALAQGFVTLGTLTRGVRINHRTVRVWSQILLRLPNARLVVDSSSFKDAPTRQALLDRFAAQGIAPERLQVGFRSPPWDVLREMDIALDCFPHNSGTTLLEGLYMGVPYVTLAGRPSVGCLGSSFLQALGRPEWIARTEDDYVQAVVDLASDLPALAQIRQSLRHDMARSPLMDELAFAQRVENAYFSMFQAWSAKTA